jgi:hypothetical protein
VHLRRAILLFALVLGLTALAAAVSPTRNATTPTTPTVSPSTPAATAEPRAVEFVSASGAPQVRRARTGEHIVLMVTAPQGGLVTIPRLGRTASVSAAAAARFDVLAPAPGRYDLLLTPSGGSGEPGPVGTLVTHP